ncbi:PAP2 superfamily protein [Tritrichomonas foetus]|uniref:PAP2 superfamily protein n=1 Tax=Tritrichomonas foetus TaxID=1144522 RepID=A0A1J4KIM9_9EUKA|nr:PAP2 superfamily protein [Tritrichomonas foetus]|eukprot:OHT10930.1 PAP2 superfamily protein [Tritrichomonas foetus]
MNGMIKIKFLNNLEIPLIDILIVVLLEIMIVYGKRLPHRVRYYPENDYSLNFPKHFKVINGKDSPMIIYLIIPIFLISANLITKKRKFRICCVLTSYFASQFISVLIIDLMKIFISRPRPDTNTICGSANFESCSRILTGKQLSNQFKSHPSGGTASMTSSCIFATLFIGEVWRKSGAMKMVLKLTPIIWCIFAAGARIIGHAHHPDDIATSVLISGSITYLVFKLTMKEPIKIVYYERLDLEE